MKITITPDQLAHEVDKILKEYNNDVRQVVNEAVTENAKSGAKELRATSPRRYGNYAKSWTTQTTKNELNEKTAVIKNRDHYQLTHLLEKGHATRNGGFSEAQRHIKPVEDNVNKEFYNDVIEGVKKL